MIWGYPASRVEDVTETCCGVSFPDPYRWLEGETQEVRDWQREQARLACQYVRDWPHFERLRALVARFNTERPERGSKLPRYAAGRWFRTRVAEGCAGVQAIVADEPMGEGRVIFDPLTENSERPPFVSWIAPSPDGCTLALGVCGDASENNAIRLVDVVTGKVLADAPSQMLMDSWTGGVHWLSDSSGFFFTALAGAKREFKQQVFLHRRLPAPTTVALDIAWITENEYRMVVVSRDGRYAVALERLFNPIPVAIAPLGELPFRWRPFITKMEGMLAGHVVGERYIAITDVHAPRGRVVSIPLDAEDVNQSQSWHELVGESEAVMRTLTPVSEALYLTELVDTYSRVRIVDLFGRAIGEVPLPTRGAVSELSFPMQNLVPKGHPRKFLFAFSSLTTSPGIYSHTPGQGEPEMLQAPRVRLENTVVEDCWAMSSDGTRIPYHLVRKADIAPTCPEPTLIYVYGAFNSPFLPQFPGPAAAFVAAGGVFVHAHLRGGGEFGLEWWHGGRLANKQNSYNDLYAVAEDLIEAQRCTPQTLAVMGGSAGGLAAGVALTQRPELWAVVVPRMARLDLIGSCRDAYGRMSTIADRANIEDSNEVRRLATFSPYHLVIDGVHYPAAFLEAGDTDLRCPSWHARKLAARLQRASTGDSPILLHVWENAGHGWATDQDTMVIQNTEWLAFALRQLRVRGWV